MSNELQKAFTSAVAKVGKQLAGGLCAAHGSRTFDTSDVPEDRQPGLLAILQRMAKGQSVNAAMASTALAGPKPPARRRTATAAERWQDIEDKAGYQEGAVKALPEGATLESIHAAAWERWRAAAKR